MACMAATACHVKEGEVPEDNYILPSSDYQNNLYGSWKTYKDKQPSSNNHLFGMFHNRTNKLSVKKFGRFCEMSGFYQCSYNYSAFGIGIRIEDIDIAVHRLGGLKNSVISSWQEVGRCSWNGHAIYGRNGPALYPAGI
ncbi:hypothetical protein CHS0354_011248 [Potamilus streckersoni]|uniref:Uncharacterized protein n=1 Tax=Potamilus streckersoni TaxID=2493646 RepID=A0AAE0VFQ2_9BIVA|nr:hypothetical protein CHS0354_011248 [Potamilus streckersoni]